jgi:hypothetical protein
MSTTFRAPWGGELTALTVISTALILAVSGFIWWQGGRLTPAFVLLVLALPLMLTVRGYEVVRGELRIRRLFWDTRWPLDAPITASVRPNVMARSWRIWGNGGMFAVSGWFSNSALGRYRAFVTDFTRTVVLDTPRGIVVVSPDQPDAFVAAIERAARAR